MAAPEDPADPAAIRARAVKLLARREHAPRELISKLARRGFDETAVADVAAELEAENLLSERRYAESMARSRVERGQGPLRIRAELSARGVGEAAIDDALAELDVDWAALASTVRRKRFGAAVPDDFPSKAKQMRFLQQRGFDGGTIRAALGD
ncbi:recombination regulator RecX [Salinisphaera sp. PC39]|uniref:regulatory protein RecX n=1 Tax=Salinisphaera sp. PC39 TaxID=1304156 RepID=UPI00333E2BCA